MKKCLKISILKVLRGACFLVLALLLSLSYFSNSVNAIEPTFNLKYYGGVPVTQVKCKSSIGAVATYSDVACKWGSLSVHGGRGLLSMSAGPIKMIKGHYYSANVTVGFTSMPGDTGRGSIALNWSQGTTPNYSLVDWKQVGSQENFDLDGTVHGYTYTFQVILLAMYSSDSFFFELGNGVNNMFYLTGSDSNYGNAQATIREIHEYSVPSDKDYSSNIQNVVNSISSMQSKQDTTNQELNQMNTELKNMNQKQEEQNNKENERYEQEKQEESDRENQGKADSNEAGGIFNFSILNPFSALFNLFKSDDCVSIPILAGFLHSQNTQYCSWFPSNVRSILTGAFNIAGMMLLFGFFVRWLSNSSSQEVEVNG